MDHLETIFCLRELNGTENDIMFSYEILKNRYNNVNSLIKYVTNPELPSYEEHKNNIKNNFKHFLIGSIHNIDMGLCYIDNKNYLGYFYDFKKLKQIFKKYPSIKHVNLSDIFFYKLSRIMPKGTILFAAISSKNTVANITVSKYMEHISNLYALEVE